MQTTLTPQQIQLLTAMGMAPQGAPATQPPQQQMPAHLQQAPIPQWNLPMAPAGPQAQPQAQPQPQQSILQQKLPAAPGLHPSLVGRSVQEVVDALVRQASQVNQQRPAAPVAQTPQGQAQQILNAGQPQQQQMTPAQMTMEQIQQAVRGAVAEVNLPQQILQLEQNVAQQVPLYNQPAIRQKVQQIIGSLPPEQQAQRGSWDYAIQLAVGEMAMSGQMQGFVAPTQQNQPWVAGNGRPSDTHLNSPAFVEAPTGNAQYAVGSRPAITQAEASFAQKLGLDPAQVAQHNTNFFGSGN